MKKISLPLVILLGLGTPSFAHESHGAEEGAAETAESHVKHQFKDHEGKNVEKEVPTDPALLWAEIQKQQVRLREVIEKEDLEAVHDETETLNLYLRKLPEISDMLDPNERVKVEAQVKSTIQLVDKIHEVGDEGAFAEAGAQLDTLDKMITLLARQYPEELIEAAETQAAIPEEKRPPAQ